VYIYQVFRRRDMTARKSEEEGERGKKGVGGVCYSVYFVSHIHMVYLIPHLPSAMSCHAMPCRFNAKQYFSHSPNTPPPPPHMGKFQIKSNVPSSKL
jgi:hypothetical protein